MGPLIASVGDLIEVPLFLDDEDVTKHPQAEIYDFASGTPSVPIATLDLVHLASGLYHASWTVVGRRKFPVLFKIYNEVGHSSRSLQHPSTAMSIIADLKDPPNVSLSVAYDDDTGTLRMHTWLFRDGSAVTDGTASTLTIYNQDGTALLTSTVGVPERQTSGAFLHIETGVVLVDNNSYTATVTVTDPLGAVSKTRGLPTLS